MLQNIGFRSKSATEKKENLPTPQICSGFKPSLKFITDQSITHHPKQPTKLQEHKAAPPEMDGDRHKNRPTIADRKLSKNPTVIDELQSLLTPRVEDTPQFHDNLWQKSKTQCLRGESWGQCGQKVRSSLEMNRSATINPIQYFRSQLDRVRSLLVNEQKKNSHLMLNISDLEHKLHLQQQNSQKLSNQLQRSKQMYQQLQAKHTELQDLSKQQAIINLELQSLIGKFTIKHGQKMKEQSQIIDDLRKSYSQKKERYQSKLKAMEQELYQAKSINTQRIHTLLLQLRKKKSSLNMANVCKSQIQKQQSQSNEIAGRSTIPSFSHLQNSRQQADARLSPTALRGEAGPQSCPQKHESPLLSNIFQLNSNVFDDVKVSRNPSKTDRI